MLAPLTALGMTAALALSPFLTPGPPPSPTPPSCAHPTIVGTSGDDVLIGTEGDDVIDAGRGDDVVHGLGGNDTICGGSGDDHLDGGPGDDLIDGGDNRDVITGGTGSDTEWGGVGDDALYTHAVEPAGPVDPASVDVLYGGSGADQLTMDAGTGRLWADGLYSHIILRGRPGDGTVLSHAAVTVAPGAAPPGGRTVSVDLQHDTVDLDGGRALMVANRGMPFTVDATGSGPEATRVTALGSNGGDDLALIGVTSASARLRGGSNTVRVDGGRHIDRMDLDLGAPDTGNLLDLRTDAQHTLVDMPGQLVSVDGRPVLHLKGAGRAVVHEGSVPDTRYSSLLVRGFRTASNELFADGFHSVRMVGGTGADRLSAFGLDRSPLVPTSWVAIDAGAGADVVTVDEAATTTVRIDGGPGHDTITAAPGSAHVRGGAGPDRCYVDGPADCEEVAPFAQHP